MATKDYQKWYPALTGTIPNTVSRNDHTGERSLATVVAESGKMVLDSELLLSQDAFKWEQDALRRWQSPSGWLRSFTRYDAINDYTVGTSPGGIDDNSGISIIQPTSATMINGFLLPKLSAMVAGRHVTVEYTNTDTPGWNLIALQAPTLYDGTSGTVKRTDFVFLEVWFALVAPSLYASGSVTVASYVTGSGGTGSSGHFVVSPTPSWTTNAYAGWTLVDSSSATFSITSNTANNLTLASGTPANGTWTLIPLAAGDLVTINGSNLTATFGSPSTNQFRIALTTASDTTINIANALTASTTFNTAITAAANSTTVTITALLPGAGGNSDTLAVTVANAGSLTVSGATLTGGANRPNKPFSNQGTLYRHGNVLSPSATWLADEILDPGVGVETSQRVQVQYRIRVTGATEAINYKTHPEGFGNTVGKVYAQGSQGSPVSNYPFVPADNNTTWLNSSATAYGIVDNGLWVAGSGSSTDAQNLGTVDGYVYAIPICFVHRLNNAYGGAYLTILNNGGIQAGDTVTIGGHALTATAGAPSSSQFQIGASASATASNIVAQVNGNAPYNTLVTAAAVGSLGIVSFLPTAGPPATVTLAAASTTAAFQVSGSSTNNVSNAGFDPQSNANGAPTYYHQGYTSNLGAIAANKSDRPDGLFCDVLDSSNVLDLRRHVFLSGLNTSQELVYQIQSLMDGSLRSWSVDIADRQTMGNASGNVSSRYLVCDEIGRTTGDGNPSTTRGVFIRSFDHVARRFGSQSVVERVVVAFYPGDRTSGASAPGISNPGKYITKFGGSNANQWCEGDQLHLDLTQFDASSKGGVFDGEAWTSSASGVSNPNVSHFMPTGTVITDILSAWHDDGNYSSAINQAVQLGVVTGLGTQHIQVNLDANPTQANGGLAGFATLAITIAGTVGNGDTVTIGGQVFTAGTTISSSTFYTTAHAGSAAAVATSLWQAIVDNGTIYPSVVSPTLSTPTVTLTAGVRGVAGEVAVTTSDPGSITVGSWVLPLVSGYNLVDPATSPSATASTRRIFLELEVTYPCGNATQVGQGTGTTCSPDLPVTPDATVYTGTAVSGQAPWVGSAVVASAAADPADIEVPQPPNFRSGYREIQLEYVTNNGTPTTAVSDTVVSRDRLTVYTPRRVYGNKTITVTDTGGGGVSKTVNTTTEYGSSSRKVIVTSNLSGAGQSLCTVTYFPQDAIPNYGASGNGFQLAVYYRSNAPQTAGVTSGSLGTAAGGIMPTTLNVEPLHISSDLWTAQVGGGSNEKGFPYANPLDQIPIQDGGAGTHEWYYSGSAELAIADFNTNTGLLALRPFVQMDTQNVLQFGGNAHPPIADAEMRSFYPFAANWVYRPTIISQPLYGVSRHKVFFPFLARIVQTVNGSDGGTLYRQNEVVLVVLTRSATLDNDNSVRFQTSGGTTVASVYRTRNLLLVAGDTYTPVPASP